MIYALSQCLVKANRSSNLLLDRIPSAAAFSLRKLRSNYFGSSIRVRRSSDNVETDIGFNSSGNLDTLSLLSHCGVSNGFITTWYDQSGNNRDLANSTAANQPRIVNAGVMEVAGGKPIIVCDGINDRLVAPTWGIVPQPFTRSMVIRTPSTITDGHIINSQNGSPNTADFYRGSGSGVGQFAGSLAENIQLVTANERIIFTSQFNRSSSFLSKNGNQSANVNPGTQGFSGIQLATYTSAQYFSATSYQEFMVFTSALSITQRQTIERNQGAYFGISLSNIITINGYAIGVDGYVLTKE